MNTFLHAFTLSAGVLLCSLASAQSTTAAPPEGKSEAAQLTQDMSPKARSHLAQREAHAAYKESMAACKSMSPAERKGCAAEAKQNLRQDLSNAKDILKSGNSSGPSASGIRESSGSSGSTGSTIGGSSDLSTSGSSGSSYSGSGSGSSSSGSGSSGASPGSGSGSTGSGMGMTGSGSASGMPMSGSQGSQPSSAVTSSMSNESSQLSEPVTAAEKKQLVQSFTPQAQYALAKREANAAYAEALKACKELSRTERSACTKDARATLQQDLAYAKRQMQEGASSTSTGSGMDSGATGTGK